MCSFFLSCVRSVRTQKTDGSGEHSGHECVHITSKHILCSICYTYMLQFTAYFQQTSVRKCKERSFPSFLFFFPPHCCSWGECVGKSCFEVQARHLLTLSTTLFIPLFLSLSPAVPVSWWALVAQLALCFAWCYSCFRTF